MTVFQLLDEAYARFCRKMQRPPTVVLVPEDAMEEYWNGVQASQGWHGARTAFEYDWRTAKLMTYRGATVVPTRFTKSPEFALTLDPLA